MDKVLIFIGLVLFIVIISLIERIKRIDRKCANYSVQIAKKIGEDSSLSLIRIHDNIEWYYFLLVDNETHPKAIYVMSCYDDDKEVKKCEKLVFKIINKTQCFCLNRLNEKHDRNTIKNYSGDCIDPTQYGKHYHYFINR